MYRPFCTSMWYCLCLYITVQLIPAALHVATAENVEFRKGLPKECLNYMGIVNCDKVSIYTCTCVCPLYLYDALIQTVG